MQAGAMRHRLRIEQRWTTRDAAGGEAYEWTLVAEVWAALVRAPGREIWASAARAGRVPVVFRCRYVDGVMPQMRAVLDGRVHDIKSARDPTGRRAEMILTTEELVGVAP